MAIVDVIMPQMGESIAEGTITKWYKKVGEKIGKDETLLEISTDKVDSEIPSPAAGVVAELLFPEQKTVDVHTIIARIQTDASVPVSAGERSSSPKTQSPKPVNVSVPVPSSQEELVREMPTRQAGRFYSPLY